MRVKLLLALVTLSLGAMSNSCKKNAEEPTPVTDGPLAVTLKVGQTQRSGPLSIKLVSIQEGRCARENCMSCYGGSATVKLDVTGVTPETQHLTFRRLSCLRPDDLTLAPADSIHASLHHVGSYKVGLINMTDFTWTPKVDPSTYDVKFLLEKK
jgi:hypothetical protein